MVVFAFLNPILNFLFGWTEALPPFWAIIILSFIIALIITFCYKWFTDQDLMKRLKTELKEFQKEMKELKEHPEQVMAIQKKAMETNMKYMTQSLKPTLITFIPIILIFGWLQATYAFEPLTPGNEFSISMQFEKGVVDGQALLTAPSEITILSNATQTLGGGQASWTLQGEKEGEYFLSYDFNNRKFSNKILITSQRGYAPQVTPVTDEQVKSITIDYDKLIVMNLFGWKLGWLGTYIIFSIVFSMGLRKLMKLY